MREWYFSGSKSSSNAAVKDFADRRAAIAENNGWEGHQCSFEYPEAMNR